MDTSNRFSNAVFNPTANHNAEGRKAEAVSGRQAAIEHLLSLHLQLHPLQLFLPVAHIYDQVAPPQIEAPQPLFHVCVASLS